jgi:hypothetical protein
VQNALKELKENKVLKLNLSKCTIPVLLLFILTIYEVLKTVPKIGNEGAIKLAEALNKSNSTLRSLVRVGNI